MAEKTCYFKAFKNFFELHSGYRGPWHVATSYPDCLWPVKRWHSVAG